MCVLSRLQRETLGISSYIPKYPTVCPGALNLPLSNFRYSSVTKMGRNREVMKLRNDTLQFGVKISFFISKHTMQFSVIMFEINLSQILA